MIHVSIVAVAVVFRRWEPIAFITLAWQIGSLIETLWQATEHIGRLQNVNDQRFLHTIHPREPIHQADLLGA